MYLIFLLSLKQKSPELPKCQVLLPLVFFFNITKKLHFYYKNYKGYWCNKVSKSLSVEKNI